MTLTFIDINIEYSHHDESCSFAISKLVWLSCTSQANVFRTISIVDIVLISIMTGKLTEMPVVAVFEW